MLLLLPVCRPRTSREQGSQKGISVERNTLQETLAAERQQGCWGLLGPREGSGGTGKPAPPKQIQGGEDSTWAVVSLWLVEELGLGTCRKDLEGIAGSPGRGGKP